MDCNQRLLLEAAAEGRVSAVKQLLPLVSQLDGCTDEEGNTALHLAAAGGHALVVRELLSGGADASRLNKAQQEPIDVACTASGRAAHAKHEIMQLITLGIMLQQLPSDPFHPKFLPHMKGLRDYILAPAATPARSGSDPPLIVLLQHLLELGYISALLQRLLPLGACTLLSAFNASPITHGAESMPSDADSPSCGTLSAFEVDIEAICAIFTQVIPVMYLAFRLQSSQAGALLRHQHLKLVAMEQLLCNPAALKVVLRRGLSAEVRAAASTGSIPAEQCMKEVLDMFRMVANTLWGMDGMMALGARGAEEAVRALAEFLGLEENLPFLELLCLHHTSFTADAPATRPHGCACTIHEGVADLSGENMFLQGASKVDTGTTCCWPLVLIACSSENSVAAWETLLSSGSLKGHLWATLEWLVAELAKQVSSLECSADEEDKQAELSRELDLMRLALLVVDLVKKHGLQKLLCTKTCALMAQLLGGLLACAAKGLTAPQGQAHGASTSSASSSSAASSSTASSSKKSSKKAAKSAKRQARQQPSAGATQQAGRVRSLFQDYTYVWAFDLLSIAVDYEGLASAMLDGWQLLNWLEVLPEVLLGYNGVSGLMAMGLKVLVDALDGEAEAEEEPDRLLESEVMSRFQAGKLQHLLVVPSDLPVIQVAKSTLISMVANRCAEVVPAITVLHMAEHALDELELAPHGSAPEHGLVSILFNANCALRHVLDRLNEQRVLEHGIKALHYCKERADLLDPQTPQPALGFLCVAIAITSNRDQFCRAFLKSPTAMQLLAWHLGSSLLCVVQPTMALLCNV